MKHPLAVAMMLCSLAIAEEKFDYDFGVAYWLPYDNDLERAGPIVLKEVSAGIRTERQVAAIQVDYPDMNGMRRHVLTSKGTTTTRVDSEDSAAEDQALAFLEWFTRSYRCRKYVFVFPNHGGRLDEMCLDEEPATEGKEWMSGQVLGEKLRKLKDEMSGTLELLFLQQCGRASLENLYSFRGTANHILASPAKIGAPNTYYTALHTWLAARPEASGDKIAEKIAAEDQHFTLYLSLKTAKLAELPTQLNAVLKPFVETASLTIPEQFGAIYEDQEERLRDIGIYLERLGARNSLGSAEFKLFDEWLANELRVTIWWNEKSPQYKALKPLSRGPSLFVPAGKDEAARYSGLQLYKDSQLPKLWSKIY